MKLLLDENLPHELRKELPGHDVYTVQYMRWDGMKNGRLLATAADVGFDAMLTMDNGVQYQQNLATLPMAVVVLSAPSNDIVDLRPLLPKIMTALQSLVPKSVVRIG
jgi:hypothetical protein